MDLSRTAVTSFTGMFTSPKLIEPLQIERIAMDLATSAGMSRIHQGDAGALLADLSEPVPTPAPPPTDRG